MKSLLIVIATFIFSLSLSAQWSVGPKVSMGVIAQKSESFRIIPMSDHGIYDLNYVGSSTVNSAGLMAYRDLGPFFLQTEILATTYSLNYKMDNYRKLDVSSPVYTETNYLLEIPFVAGVKSNNFKFGVGPVMELNVNKDSHFQQFDYYKNTSDKVEFGFQGLVGYTFGKIHLDLKYVNKFNSIADGFNFGNDTMKLKQSANRISLSVGIVL